jgi:hypothetical protein
MNELTLKPGEIYEFLDIENFRVFLRLKYLETVFNPITKEIRLHFEKLEDSVEQNKDIYLNQHDIYQQIGRINEATEYQIRYEY